MAARTHLSGAAFLTVTLASVALQPVSAQQNMAVRAAPPAFFVSESEAGDLNADGDAGDAVLHVFDTRQRTAVNLRVAAATICRTVMGPPFSICDPVLPVIGRSVIAFLVGEPAQGATDLNGDGDAIDDVLFLYDATTRRTLNTGLAVGHGVGRDVSSFTFPVMPVVSGDGIAVLVGEAEQGGTDLNLDGDIEDDVLYTIDPKSGESLNLELAVAVVSGPFGARNPIPLQVQGRQVTFVAGEIEQGGFDLNGDGDRDDQVAYLLNLQNGKLRPGR